MGFKGFKYGQRYKQLINLLPSKIENWVEPFGGRYGMAKMLMNDNYLINNYIYNDKDYDLYKEFKDLDNSYNLDYKEILDKFNCGKYFHFIDPPYYGKEHYYKIKFNKHMELNNFLKQKCKFNFMLFYNDHEHIRKIYSNFRIIEMEKTLYKNEIVILNY